MVVEDNIMLWDYALPHLSSIILSVVTRVIKGYNFELNPTFFTSIEQVSSVDIPQTSQCASSQIPYKMRYNQA